MNRLKCLFLVLSYCVATEYGEEQLTSDSHPFVFLCFFFNCVEHNGMFLTQTLIFFFNFEVFVAENEYNAVAIYVEVHSMVEEGGWFVCLEAVACL